jgi:hypothetical protein
LKVREKRKQSGEGEGKERAVAAIKGGRLKVGGCGVWEYRHICSQVSHSENKWQQVVRQQVVRQQAVRQQAVRQQAVRQSRRAVAAVGSTDMLRHQAAKQEDARRSASIEFIYVQQYTQKQEEGTEETCSRRSIRLHTSAYGDMPTAEADATA